MEWLDAWKMAMDAHFVGAERDDNVHRMLSIQKSMMFQAPEAVGHLGREAWAIFVNVGDTEVGRAAVALAYIINDIWKGAQRYAVVAPPKNGPLHQPLPTVTGS